ncbi:MAG: DNRLRE domain-containing protein [Planctomycetota bacterium]
MTRSTWNWLFYVTAVLPSAPLLGSTTITLQDGSGGYAGTTDAWLNEGSKTKNYGADPILHIQWNNGRSDATLVRFELAGQIPLHQRILSAKLYLYYGSAESMGPSNAIELKPFRVTLWWYENVYVGEAGNGVNWRWRDDGQTLEWTGQDGAWWDKIDDGNTTRWIQDSDGEVGGNPPPIKPGNWVDFTVTNSVKAWYEQGAANYGFSLFSTNFVGSGYIAAGLFSSRNHGTSWSRPELEITYEGALPPIADADGPYSVVFAGSVMFDGRGSHDPDGGSITSWLWDLDADGQYDDATGQTSTKTWDYLVNTLHLAPGSHTIGLKVFDDENESTVDTAQLEIYPEPGNGDFNEDNDVDLADFAEFQVCFGESPVSPGCEPGDMNGTNRVDLLDYALFRAALEASGPK